MFYDWSAVMDQYWLLKKDNEEESCLSFRRAAGIKERSSAFCEMMSQLKIYIGVSGQTNISGVLVGVFFRCPCQEEVVDQR